MNNWINYVNKKIHIHDMVIPQTCLMTRLYLGEHAAGSDEMRTLGDPPRIRSPLVAGGFHVFRHFGSIWNSEWTGVSFKGKTVVWGYIHIIYMKRTDKHVCVLCLLNSSWHPSFLLQIVLFLYGSRLKLRKRVWSLLTLPTIPFWGAANLDPSPSGKSWTQPSCRSSRNACRQGFAVLCLLGN